MASSQSFAPRFNRIPGRLAAALACGVWLAPGSVVVQRGTHHAWANRSGKTCRMRFALVDAAYPPANTDALARRIGHPPQHFNARP